MPTTIDRKLLHTIGRWSLTGLVMNMVIGSGIFGLPSILIRLLGEKSPWAYVIAALGIAAITGCLAEVGSQFSEAGGPYLYARVAYGRFAGIQIAWLTWLVRLTSGAANANIFIEYLGGFFPGAQGRIARAVVLFVLIGALAAINIIGVKAGANVSSLLAVAKIAPLLIFIVAGLVLLHGAGTHSIVVPASVPGPQEWLSAVLLIIFAMSGFEAALIPMGEARDARHDIPFALSFSLIICVVLYILIQVVVLQALGAAAVGDRPLAEAARVFLGHGGAMLMQVGALLSVYGNLSSQMLNVPRITFALAERGDFPSAFGVLSQKFRTPYISIATFAAIVFLLAVLGTFQGNAVLSVVARLLTYGVVCAAVITLRRKQPNANAFRLRAAPLVSALGMLFVLALVTQMGIKEVIAIAGVMAVALVNWIWARRRLVHPSPAE
jgi:basic amino acid/polyamine antiporter, APA family